LLAALLHVSADEFFGVLLEHGVDLVKQVVDILAQLLDPLGDLRVDLGCDDVLFLVAPRLPGLGLPARFPRSHASSSSGGPPTEPLHRTYPEVIASSRSFALGHLSNSAPTCFLVPRSGSIIGTRTSDSRPTSKMTESQLAATTSAGYFA